MCAEGGIEEQSSPSQTSNPSGLVLSQIPLQAGQGTQRVTNLKHTQGCGSVPVTMSGATPALSFPRRVGGGWVTISLWLLSEEVTSLLLSRNTVEYWSGSLESGAGAGETGTMGGWQKERKPSIWKERKFQSKDIAFQFLDPDDPSSPLMHCPAHPSNSLTIVNIYLSVQRQPLGFCNFLFATKLNCCNLLLQSRG